MRILSKVLVVCTILLAGCAPDRDAATNRFISRGTLAQQGTENGDEISYWDGTGSGGESRIVIDLDQQRAYFYKGDQIVGVSAVSTGREGYDTPPGEFRIMEKDREHLWRRPTDYVLRGSTRLVDHPHLAPERNVYRRRNLDAFQRLLESQCEIGRHSLRWTRAGRSRRQHPARCDRP
jgi:hypothetical protein